MNGLIGGDLPSSATAMPLIAEQRCNAPRPTSKRLVRVDRVVGPGVRDVVNCLAVEPEREDGPVKVFEAVRTVLGKHAFADANRVQVALLPAQLSACRLKLNAQPSDSTRG